MFWIILLVYIQGSFLAYALIRRCYQKAVGEWTAEEGKAIPAVLLLSWGLVLFLLLLLLDDQFSREPEIE
jgi:hypothetical protein